MSLFGDPRYQWRETYFVYFSAPRCPTGADLQRGLQRLNRNYQIQQQSTADGRLESLTLVSPIDFAAMDISLVTGEDVTRQVTESLSKLLASVAAPRRIQLRQRLLQADARFEVFHFENRYAIAREEAALADAQQVNEDDEFLDPGALLVVLKKISDMCSGVIVDPQADCVM